MTKCVVKKDADLLDGEIEQASSPSYRNIPAILKQRRALAVKFV